MVEVLEQKGLCPKQDLLDVDREVHRRLTAGRGGYAPCTPQSPNDSHDQSLNTDPHSCHRAHTRRDG